MRILVTKSFLIVALAIPVVAMAAIGNSKHDLASTSTTTSPKASTQNQTCVFCHTPHRATAQALLWNHTASALAHAFTAGTTNDGTTLPSTITASSKRCLSCHDGSVALGSVNNAGGGAAGTIAMAAHADINAGGQLTAAAYLVGSGGNMDNNHPVSIPYAGSTYNTIASSATAADYSPATTTGCTSPSGICTSVATDGPVINLVGTGVAAAGVECSTCHEVHNKFSANAYFLRVSESSSRLCKACHLK